VSCGEHCSVFPSVRNTRQLAPSAVCKIRALRDAELLILEPSPGVLAEVGVTRSEAG